MSPGHTGTLKQLLSTSHPGPCFAGVWALGGGHRGLGGTLRRPCRSFSIFLLLSSPARTVTSPSTGSRAVTPHGCSPWGNRGSKSRPGPSRSPRPDGWQGAGTAAPGQWPTAAPTAAAGQEGDRQQGLGVLGRTQPPGGPRFNRGRREERGCRCSPSPVREVSPGTPGCPPPVPRPPCPLPAPGLGQPAARGSRWRWRGYETPACFLSAGGAGSP